MKPIIQLLTFVFLVWLYSCSSDSKKQTGDLDAKPNSHKTAVQTTNPEANDSVGLNKPVDTSLIFPEFTIKLHDFDVSYGADGQGKPYVNEDVYNNQGILIHQGTYWRLKIKHDTAYLEIYGWAQPNLMELIPKNKNDNFKISHTIEVQIIELTKGKILYTVRAPEKYLKDSANYFFKIVGHVYDMESDTAEVKKLLNLKDTSVRYKAGDGNYYTNKRLVSYQKKACDVLAVGSAFFKIERYNGGKLIETKFLIIKGADHEPAD